jgi:hypothetical protein
LGNNVKVDEQEINLVGQHNAISVHMRGVLGEVGIIGDVPLDNL